MDDDFDPSNENFRLMVDYVRKEEGFPDYAEGIPRFYGSTERICSAMGYTMRVEMHPRNPSPNRYILTNFVSMSTELNRQFVDEYKSNEVYREAMQKNGGN